MINLLYPFALPIFCLCCLAAQADEEFTVMGEFTTFVSDIRAGDIPPAVAAVVYLKGIVCMLFFPLVVLYKEFRP